MVLVGIATDAVGCAIQPDDVPAEALLQAGFLVVDTFWLGRVGPVALAAWAKSIPVALHEQNRIPGMTNRLSAPLAQRIYLSYADDAGRFNPAKVRLTGNPVRSAIIAWRQAAAALPVTGNRDGCLYPGRRCRAR